MVVIYWIRPTWSHFLDFSSTTLSAICFSLFTLLSFQIWPFHHQHHHHPSDYQPHSQPTLPSLHHQGFPLLLHHSSPDSFFSFFSAFLPSSSLLVQRQPSTHSHILPQNLSILKTLPSSLLTTLQIGWSVAQPTKAKLGHLSPLCLVAMPGSFSNIPMTIEWPSSSARPIFIGAP